MIYAALLSRYSLKSYICNVFMMFVPKKGTSYIFNVCIQDLIFIPFTKTDKGHHPMVPIRICNPFENRGIDQMVLLDTGLLIKSTCELNQNKTVLNTNHKHFQLNFIFSNSRP